MSESDTPAAVAPKTGVYAPVGGAKLAEENPFPEDFPSRLNLTG